MWFWPRCTSLLGFRPTTELRLIGAMLAIEIWIGLPWIHHRFAKKDGLVCEVAARYREHFNEHVDQIGWIASELEAGASSTESRLTEPVTLDGAATEVERSAAESLSHRGLKLDQVIVDGVFDAAVDPVASVLVCLDDHEATVFECSCHPAAATERRTRITGRANNDDRACAHASDGDPWIKGVREEGAAVGPRGVWEQARCSPNKYISLFISFFDGQPFWVVRTRDRLERLEQVAVGPIGTPLVVRILECEKPSAVTGLGIFE